MPGCSYLNLVVLLSSLGSLVTLHIMYLCFLFPYSCLYSGGGERDILVLLAGAPRKIQAHLELKLSRCPHYCEVMRFQFPAEMVLLYLIVFYLGIFNKTLTEMERGNGVKPKQLFGKETVLAAKCNVLCLLPALTRSDFSSAASWSSSWCSRCAHMGECHAQSCFGITE